MSNNRPDEIAGVIQDKLIYKIMLGLHYFKLANKTSSNYNNEQIRVIRQYNGVLYNLCLHSRKLGGETWNTN